jgi:plasmid stability protein
MATLQVRDIDDNLYQSLKNRASQEKRSISQEVIYVLERYLARPTTFDVNPTDEFLQLAGSWDDDRSADEIVTEIRAGRNESSRFGGHHELFD